MKRTRKCLVGLNVKASFRGYKKGLLITELDCTLCAESLWTNDFSVFLHKSYDLSFYSERYMFFYFIFIYSENGKIVGQRKIHRLQAWSPQPARRNRPSQDWRSQQQEGHHFLHGKEGCFRLQGQEQDRYSRQQDPNRHQSHLGKGHPPTR